MKVQFINKQLLALYTTGVDHRYSKELITCFFKRMSTIRAAKDERDLYEMKSLHFEKLKGNRSHQRSIRLDHQYRLVIEIQKDSTGNTVLVIDIEDYH